MQQPVRTTAPKAPGHHSPAPRTCRAAPSHSGSAPCTGVRCRSWPSAPWPASPLRTSPWPGRGGSWRASVEWRVGDERRVGGSSVAAAADRCPIVPGSTARSKHARRGRARGGRAGRRPGGRRERRWVREAISCACTIPGLAGSHWGLLCRPLLISADACREMRRGDAEALPPTACRSRLGESLSSIGQQPLPSSSHVVERGREVQARRLLGPRHRPTCVARGVDVSLMTAPRLPGSPAAACCHCR